jgi:hypothetical protein
LCFFFYKCARKNKFSESSIQKVASRNAAEKEVSLIDEIVAAFRDDRVLDAIGSVFAAKMQSMLNTINCLEIENTKLSDDAKKISALREANARIEQLENYSR